MRNQVGPWGMTALLIGALTLAACGTGSSSTNPSPSGGKMKVAMLLPGSVSDHGWNADGKLTADGIKGLGADVAYTEGVQVANQADVYRQYARQGYDLVIGWGGQYTDGAAQVGKEFPKVKFLVNGSSISQAPNVGSVDYDAQNWQYIAGYVMAMLSKSNVIGVVGGICFPATANQVYPVADGAKAAKPNIKVLTTFTGDFEDATKAQQAAQAMISQGADVLTGNLNNGYFGLFKAAEAGNAKVITEWFDNKGASPAIVASVNKDQALIVVPAVKDALQGSFNGKHYQQHIAGTSAPAIINDALPADVYQASLDLQTKIANGTVTPKPNMTCPS